VRINKSNAWIRLFFSVELLLVLEIPPAPRLTAARLVTADSVGVAEVGVMDEVSKGNPAILIVDDTSPSNPPSLRYICECSL
jgi:hypothetical protein